LTDYKTVSYLELQDVSMNCIGHLTIPHPAKILGNKFMTEYEKKKDDFLDTVQKLNSVDYLSTIAQQVVKNKTFLKMEMLYRKAKGDKFRGIPEKKLKEIVNIIHPELRRNNECITIAEKIGQMKVLSEEWLP
jgi:hypothetical protein